MVPEHDVLIKTTVRKLDVKGFIYLKFPLPTSILLTMNLFGGCDDIKEIYGGSFNFLEIDALIVYSNQRVKEIIPLGRDKASLERLLTHEIDRIRGKDVVIIEAKSQHSKNLSDFYGTLGQIITYRYLLMHLWNCKVMRIILVCKKGVQEEVGYAIEEILRSTIDETPVQVLRI